MNAEENKQTTEQENSVENTATEAQAKETDTQAAEESTSEEEVDTAEAKPESTEHNKIEEELAEMKDKYLRLYSDFENFRRRTAKEKVEFMKTANEELLRALLPILDDFERAQKSISDNPENPEIIKEGFDIIQNKFIKTLESKGVKPMGDLKGVDFDSDLHEAITQIPAPEDALKGKIVDVVEQGYWLEDKVIRFAKVVVGS